MRGEQEKKKIEKQQGNQKKRKDKVKERGYICNEEVGWVGKTYQNKSVKRKVMMRPLC